jgi:hypothetical protein
MNSNTIVQNEKQVISAYLAYHSDIINNVSNPKQRPCTCPCLTFQESVLFSYSVPIAVLIKDGVFLASNSSPFKGATRLHLKYLFDELPVKVKSQLIHVPCNNLLAYVNRTMPHGVTVSELVNQFFKGARYHGRGQTNQAHSPLPTTSGTVNCFDNRVYVGCTLLGEIKEKTLVFSEYLPGYSPRVVSAFLKKEWASWLDGVEG